MSVIHWDNSAVLWKNHLRETDSHPHYRGRATIDGVLYLISAWETEPKREGDDPYIRIKFTKYRHLKDFVAVAQPKAPRL